MLCRVVDCSNCCSCSRTDQRLACSQTSTPAMVASYQQSGQIMKVSRNHGAESDPVANAFAGEGPTRDDRRQRAGESFRDAERG